MAKPNQALMHLTSVSESTYGHSAAKSLQNILDPTGFLAAFTMRLNAVICREQSPQWMCLYTTGDFTLGLGTHACTYSASLRVTYAHVCNDVIH